MQKKKYAACVSSVFTSLKEKKNKQTKKTRKDKKNQAQSLGSSNSSFTARFADLEISTKREKKKPNSGSSSALNIKPALFGK